MNERFKNLAERADFIFWGNEEWKPEGAVIDWATNYDKEFEEYSKLLVAECARIARKYILDTTGAGNRYGGTVFVEEEIRKTFGLEHTGSAPQASGNDSMHQSGAHSLTPPWEC